MNRRICPIPTEKNRAACAKRVKNFAKGHEGKNRKENCGRSNSDQFLESQSPCPQKRTAAVIESPGEINRLRIIKRPRQTRRVAFMIVDWQDSSVVARIAQGKKQFALDPARSDRVRSEQNDKPIAAAQRHTDFVMPLLGTEQIGFTIPDRNAVTAQHGSNL